MRPDHGPGRHTDRGDDAVHAGPDQQAVQQVHAGSAHTGRLRQRHVRSGDGHRFHQRSVYNLYYIFHIYIYIFFFDILC